MGVGGAGCRGPAIGKDHGPGHGAWPAIELAIDEIGEPAQPEADRHAAGGEIEQAIEAQIVASCIEPGCGHDTEKAAMERHAAMPDLQYGEGVARILWQV